MQPLNGQNSFLFYQVTIQFISMNKGGLAGILYSQLLDKSTDQGEKDIYYQVGMLGQFVDM